MSNVPLISLAVSLFASGVVAGMLVAILIAASGKDK